MPRPPAVEKIKTVDEMIAEEIRGLGEAPISPGHQLCRPPTFIDHDIDALIREEFEVQQRMQQAASYNSGRRVRQRADVPRVGDARSVRSFPADVSAFDFLDEELDLAALIAEDGSTPRVVALPPGRASASCPVARELHAASVDELEALVRLG